MIQIKSIFISAHLTHIRSLCVINVLYNSDSFGVLTLSLWSLTLQPLEDFKKEKIIKEKIKT